MLPSPQAFKQPSTVFVGRYDDVTDDAVEVVIVSKVGDWIGAEKLTLGGTV